MSTEILNAKVRSSNIELLRIVCMFFVVARHFVGQSGVEELYDYSLAPTANMLWMQFWGMWGKTMINAFVLITGYFMCTGCLTKHRLMKIAFPMVFWHFAIYFLFLLFGCESASPVALFKVCTHFFGAINKGFSVSFFWFYLGIPFYNLLLKSLDRKTHALLAGLLCLQFTVASTFFFNTGAFNHTFWYMTLYFVGSYIRLYPMSWMSKNRICVPILLGCIGIAHLEVIVADYAVAYGFTKSIFEYWLVCDSDKLLALVIGVLLFLTFKNLKVGQSRIVNTIASTTFGILLIHSSSSAIRKFLWIDLFDVAGHYGLSTCKLVAFSVGAVACVYVVCSALEFLRIRLLEKPIMKVLFKC